MHFDLGLQWINRLNSQSAMVARIRKCVAFAILERQEVVLRCRRSVFSKKGKMKLTFNLERILWISTLFRWDFRKTIFSDLTIYMTERRRAEF